jgi:uncharacterized hydrophobic protein (TIGR00271 family)
LTDEETMNAINTKRLSLLRLFDLRRDLDHPDQIDAGIRAGVVLSGTNLWVLILAMLIASIGLDVNSTAAIIGAMLISPLMGPIVGLGYGLAIQDTTLIRRALRTLVIAVAFSLLASTLYFALSPLVEPGSELRARTSPTLWDVLIAFFGGAAGFIALTRRNFSNVVPGVAIATALMPPLCTAGYAIAHARWDWLLGALYLFSINGVFIAMATLLFAKMMRLRPPQGQVAEASLAMGRWLTAMTVLALVLPSVYLGWKVVRTQAFERELNAEIDAAARLADVVVLRRDVRADSRTVELTIAGNGSAQDIEAQLRASAARAALGNVAISVRSVTAPQLDMTAVRRALGDDIERIAARQAQTLREQNEALRLVHAARTDRDAELGRVADEIRAQHPQLRHVVVAGAAAPPTAVAAPSAVLVQLDDDPRLSAKDRARLRQWLTVRLPGQDVQLAFARPVGAR